jgi:hypothetical protein
MKTLSNINEQKQVLVIDALRLSLEIERVMNSRLWRVLRNIEKVDDTSHPRPIAVLNAIGLAWQLIDTTYRIRGLAEQVKGLSHKLPEYQLFQRNTASTESFRNFFQHLNSEIPKLPTKTNPIIGALSWVTKVPSKSRTIVYGTFPKDGSFHSLAVDTWAGRFATKLEFTAGQKDLDIDNVHKEVTRFRIFFSKWLLTNGFLGKGELHASVLNFYIQNLKA